MSSDLTPEGIRSARFQTSLRGLDRAEVEAFLGRIAERLDELETDNERLQDQLGKSEVRDLESEFEAVGSEVSSILQAAREAADTMRERASIDSARWRSEAMEEAETNRREAVADAEALRRDAWATGTALLEQAVSEAHRIREQAERDVLTVMGEAEREAHRLTSSSRREAEDLLRNASMDAEKMTSEAARRRDDIIDAANRQAAAAQERTRALEERRDELLEELENVRSTLTRLEGSLEEKRESMDFSSGDFSTVRVIPPQQPEVVEPEETAKTWEPGETVRVVQSERKRPPVSPPPQVKKPVSAPEPPIEEAGEPDVAEEAIEEPAPSPMVETPESPAGETETTPPPPEEPSEPDDVSALFAALRGGGHPEAESRDETFEETQGEPEAEEEPEAAPPRPPDHPDWGEEREARLLPITNRALRGAKKAITDLQNVALDALRTDEDWRPDPAEITEAIQAELIGVWAESFAAGHAVAEEMSGGKLKRPPTPSSDAAGEFAQALARAVGKALDEAGDGQRERQSAASRAYRVWRTDEAERRIRELAQEAYERAIVMSMGAGSSTS